MMRRLLILALLCIPFAAHAQTATYQYAASGCGASATSACNIVFFAGSKGAAGPALVYLCGGGYTSCSVGCPQKVVNAINTCPDYTYWNQLGYNVFQPDYTIVGNGNLMTQLLQSAGCAMAYIAQNLGGLANLNQTYFAGDSAGTTPAFDIGASTNGYFNTGTCSSSSTAWKTAGFPLMDGFPGCLTADTNCFCDPNLTDNPNYDSGKCATIFGALPNMSNPTAYNMAKAASPNQYFTMLKANGVVPIMSIVGTVDAVISPSVQYQFQIDAAAAGVSVMLTKCVGQGHGCDLGTLSTATACNSWPINFQTAPVSCFQTTNCKYGSTCTVLGQYAEPSFTLAVGSKSTGAAGSTGAAATAQ